MLSLTVEITVYSIGCEIYMIDSPKKALRNVIGKMSGHRIIWSHRRLFRNILSAIPSSQNILERDS